MYFVLAQTNWQRSRHPTGCLQMLSMVLSCFWYGHMLGGWAIVGALIVFFTLFDKSRRALPTRMVIRFARFPECVLAACPRMLVYFLAPSLLQAEVAQAVRLRKFSLVFSRDRVGAARKG